MSLEDDDSRFIAAALPGFISEAQEQIALLEQQLLQLESDGAGDDRELLNALFRSTHTIKGAAGIFGADAVVAFTHHVETLLEQLRAGRKALSPEICALLLACTDQMRDLVDAAAQPRAESAEVAQVSERLVRRLRAEYGDAQGRGPTGPGVAAPRAGARPLRRWRISVQFGPDTFRNGLDPLGVLNYLRGFGTIVDLGCDSSALPDLETLDPACCHWRFRFSFDSAAPQDQIESAFSLVRQDCVLNIIEAEPPETKAVPKATERGAVAGAADETRYIRVEAKRLDQVIDLLGELVIAGAGASLLARHTRARAMVEATQKITTLVEEIRNGTLKLRMVPIGDTFARFRRVVRDTATELGKDIALELKGGETELDKSVVERIVDPLMHLVRNALDHGLETPAQRTHAGKPPQGRLTLAACHESGSVVIHISDDGRGIDRDQVLKKAWDRGLVEPGVVPSDPSILNLIFEPGFSTADEVTRLSGRGVGMDVVRRNIEALRGEVALSSEPGRGACVEIRLPLTLAIIDGFLVGVGPSKFIIPLGAVIEVIECGGIEAEPQGRGRSVVELRGRMLPVVNLRSLYALPSTEPARRSIVVVQSSTVRYGVMVDLLLGQHQTVIKPLGTLLAGLRGISGSTILGNGEVALIIDVATLGDLAGAAKIRERPALAGAQR